MNRRNRRKKQSFLQEYLVTSKMGPVEDLNLNWWFCFYWGIIDKLDHFLLYCRINCYQFDFFEVFADLPQPHRCVREHFLLFHLFVQDLGENHLKGHGDPSLLQVFFEHICLLLFPVCFVVKLNMGKFTSSSCYCSASCYSYWLSSSFGSSFGGGTSYFAGSSTFFGSSFFGYSFFGCSFFGGIL